MIVQGCSDNDLSDCGFNLRFQYTMNLDFKDKLGEEVDRIVVYVFGQDSLFINEFPSRGTITNDYLMWIPMLSGKYSFIAWGNPQTTDYEMSSFVKGKTHLNEAMLTLNQGGGNIVNRQIGSLFYGSRQNTDIIADFTGKRTYDVPMVKDTKSITVTVRGLNFTETKALDDEYAVNIQSRNSHLNFVDNRINSADGLTVYIPDARVENWDLVSEFVVMRELVDASTQSHLIVTSDDGVVKTELFNRALTSLLMAGRTIDDFERRDHFDILIEFDNYGTATVTVSGWNDINGGDPV
jgi:hypothetical protein